MNFGRLLKRRLHLVVLTIVFAATMAMESLSMFQAINEALVSARMRATSIEASGRFVFVSIDARSLHSLGVWPWPREVYAAVVRTLMEAGATEVYLDLDLSARSTPEGDAALAAALEEAGGSVILPVFRQQRGFGIREMTRNMPISDFREHAWLGVITLPVDDDGLVRRYPYGARVDGANMPSVAALLSGKFGPPGTEFLINYGIDPQTIPSVSLIDLLLGHAQVALEDRSIVVGAHAMELRSPVAIPVHGVVPGPLVHILAAETLARDLELKRLSPMPGLVGVGVLCLFIAARGRGHMPLVVATLAGVAASIELLAFWAHAVQHVIVPTGSLHKMLLVTGIIVGARELDLRRLLLQMVQMEMLNTERILERVITDSSDAILIADEDLCLLRVSDIARDLFDRPSATQGDALESVVPQEIVDAADEALDDLREGRRVQSTTREVSVHRDGATCIVEYTVTPSRLLKLADSARTREEGFVVCLSARDVTDGSDAADGARPPGAVRRADRRAQSRGVRGETVRTYCGRRWRRLCHRLRPAPVPHHQRHSRARSRRSAAGFGSAACRGGRTAGVAHCAAGGRPFRRLHDALSDPGGGERTGRRGGHAGWRAVRSRRSGGAKRRQDRCRPARGGRRGREPGEQGRARAGRDQDQKRARPADLRQDDVRQAGACKAHRAGILVRARRRPAVPRLPAAGAPCGWRRGRGGGPGTVASSRARHDLAGRVHHRGREQRVHRAPGQVGAGDRLPRRDGLAAAAAGLGQCLADPVSPQRHGQRCRVRAGSQRPAGDTPDARDHRVRSSSTRSASWTRRCTG